MQCYAFACELRASAGSRKQSGGGYATRFCACAPAHLRPAWLDSSDPGRQPRKHLNSTGTPLDFHATRNERKRGIHNASSGLSALLANQSLINKRQITNSITSTKPEKSSKQEHVKPFAANILPWILLICSPIKEVD